MDKRNWRAAPGAPASDDPLDYLAYEHFKYREMCNDLDRLADAAEFDRGAVTKLAETIRADLTMHVFDEEEGLFPLLRQRCRPEDEVAETLERMTREHAERMDCLARARIALLTAFTDSKPLPQIAGASETLHACAQSLRRLIMLENGVLIPLARRRLLQEDIAALSARFAIRRRTTPA